MTRFILTMTRFILTTTGNYVSADHNEKNTMHRQLKDKNSLEEKFDLGLVLIYKQILVFCISLMYKLETS